MRKMMLVVAARTSEKGQDQDLKQEQYLKCCSNYSVLIGNHVEENLLFFLLLLDELLRIESQETITRALERFLGHRQKVGGGDGG